jgi:uncharacterized membrane protein YukC
MHLRSGRIERRARYIIATCWVGVRAIEERKRAGMPGYKEYLDVESAVKILGNLVPEGQGDESAWQQVSEMAQKLDDNAANLVAATEGRSQEGAAKELKEITEQVAAAAAECAAGADEGKIATTQGAINALPSYLSNFDEERLKRK